MTERKRSEVRYGTLGFNRIEAIELDPVYADALVYIAQGETRDDTFTELLDAHTDIEAEQIREEMAQALTDALKQGVEREDIDPSWF